MSPFGSVFDSIDKSIKEVACKSDTLMFIQKSKKKQSDQNELKNHVLSLIFLFEGCYRETPEYLKKLLDPPSISQSESQGSYFTPVQIVEFICQATINEGIKQHLKGVRKVKEKLEKIFSYRICDPCCGGGIFLLVAHDHLMKAVLKVTRNKNVPKDAASRTVHCLFGVDINPRAVGLTRELLQLNTLKWDLRDKWTEYANSAGISLDSFQISLGNAKINGQHIAQEPAQKKRNTEQITPTNV